MVYTHAPLNPSSSEFRLLVLMPARNKRSRIQCKVRVHDLASPPDYEALSYTWGDWSEPKHIFLDGCVFRITHNLFEALLHLRNLSDPRTLWVDAICINQSDNWERNHQVRQMRNIYARATSVEIWLGNSDVDIDLAMEFLASDKVVSNEEGLASAIPGLRKILHKPWWSRMWVVQEVIVPKKDPRVHCGYTCISWFRIRILFTMILAREQIEERVQVLEVSDVDFRDLLGLTGIRDSWHGDHGPKGSLDLASMLISTSNRDARDPRDHVFALLGLLPDGQIDLEIDYHQEIATVYQRAMSEAMKSAGNTELLYQAVGPRQVDNLPSWCVDFSMKNWNKGMNEWIVLAIHGSEAYNAESEFLRREHHHNPDNGELGITANIIGEIDAVVLPQTASRERQGGRLGTGRSSLDDFYNFKEDVQSLVGHDNYAEALLTIQKFRNLARIALDTRYGEKKALRLIRKGLTWKIIAGGFPFRETYSLCFNEEDRDSLPDEYSLVERWWHEWRSDVEQDNVYRQFASDDSYSTSYESDDSQDEDDEQDEDDVDYEDSENESDKNDDDENDGIENDNSKFKGIGIDDMGKVDINLLKLVMAMARQATDVALFTTWNGRIGKASHIIEEGDILCFLNGCKRPAVVRPKADGSHQLVTFTYTHGLTIDEEDKDWEHKILKNTFECVELRLR